MTDDQARQPEPGAAAEIPAEWLTTVSAAYNRVDNGVRSRISGAALGQLRGELSLALRQGTDGPYPDAWALDLPAALHRVIGDAAAWQAHLARQNIREAEAEYRALNHRPPSPSS